MTDLPSSTERTGREVPDPEAADLRLVARFLRSRDETAFRDLYRRHAAILYRYCLATLRESGAAESAVQETWLRAVRHLERFDGRSTLRSWLVGIARNCCRELRRERARLRPVPDPDETIPERWSSGTHRIDLQRAVDALPPRARSVLLLHDVEGCTHVEIGDMLEIDAGTSKSQLSRARRLLRRALSGGER